ncbi:MAG: hypothetical protein RL693_356, partial [Verrucomicrobiota bacterium]
MPNPYLADSFYVPWSTLTPDAVEADITEALARAE